MCAVRSKGYTDLPASDWVTPSLLAILAGRISIRWLNSLFCSPGPRFSLKETIFLTPQLIACVAPYPQICLVTALALAPSCEDESSYGDIQVI